MVPGIKHWPQSVLFSSVLSKENAPTKNTVSQKSKTGNVVNSVLPIKVYVTKHSFVDILLVLTV